MPRRSSPHWRCKNALPALAQFHPDGLSPMLRLSRAAEELLLPGRLAFTYLEMPQWHLNGVTGKNCCRPTPRLTDHLRSHIPLKSARWSGGAAALATARRVRCGELRCRAAVARLTRSASGTLSGYPHAVHAAASTAAATAPERLGCSDLIRLAFGYSTGQSSARGLVIELGWHDLRVDKLHYRT
jgi:hypothetical protein